MATATIPAQRGMLARLYAAGVADEGLWLEWDDERGFRWIITLKTVDDAVRVLRLAALYRWEEAWHGQVW